MWPMFVFSLQLKYEMNSQNINFSFQKEKFAGLIYVNLRLLKRSKSLLFK